MVAMTRPTSSRGVADCSTVMLFTTNTCVHSPTSSCETASTPIASQSGPPASGTRMSALLPITVDQNMVGPGPTPFMSRTDSHAPATAPTPPTASTAPTQPAGTPAPSITYGM